MKRMIVLALALGPVFGWAQSYELKIKLSGAKAVKAYLVTGFEMTTQKVLDSAVAQKNVFVFKDKASADPVAATVIIDHTGSGLPKRAKDADSRIVYLGADRILFSGSDSVAHAKVSGSKINADYAVYDAMVEEPVRRAWEPLNEKYASMTAEQKKAADLMVELNKMAKVVFRLKDSLTEAYIRTNPDSYISLIKLREIAGKYMEAHRIGGMFDQLSARVRGTSAGVAFAKEIESARRTSVGAVAPDFTEGDTAGRPVKLSDFRGKYVLLDFWASWCGPCRAENPNVVKAYDKYKDRNFTVLGVSLDGTSTKKAWLSAIAKDSLIWTQVSDLQAWGNAAAQLYGIKAIPQNFLIDPTGKIIGKNLRGEDLWKKLSEVL